MNPKPNTTVAPQTSSSNDFHLHAQELRHLGLLRRFKRACDEGEGQNNLPHETDRLRFDPQYRSAILHALAHSNDAQLKVWLDPVTQALNALDVIHEHLKASDDRLKAVAQPQASQAQTAVPKRKALPLKQSFNWGEHWQQIAVGVLLFVVTLVGAWVWQKQTSPAPAAQIPSAPSVATAFRMHGSNTIGEALAPALVNAFVRQQNGQLAEVRSEQPLEKLITFRVDSQAPLQGVELHAHGSSTAYTGLKDAKADIGMSSRPIKNAENDALTPLHGDMRALGAGVLRYESSNALSDAVASTPGGIGFIGLPYVRQSRAVPVADTVASTAFLPSFFTVSTEDYPLSRRLFLYASMQRLSAQAKEFMEFVQSDAGQEVVRQSGFVPQLIAAKTVNAPGNAPEEYIQLTRTAQRLSFTFRFRSGTSELDSKATRDMRRLLSYLARNQGKSVHLLGFADAVGAAQNNMQLSKNRADRVARVLNSAGVIPQQVLGMGGALPVASNDDEIGRNRNRRVEVWVGG